MGFRDQLKHAYNAFVDQEKTERRDPFLGGWNNGASYGVRPDRVRLRVPNERTIITSIYVRMAIDIASANIRHILLDDDNRYLRDVQSGLNQCLSVEANLDQASSAFMMDIAMTTLDKGVAAVVPTDTDISPDETGGFDIQTMRVGEITEWMPRHVRVDLYNENTGRREEITLEKKNVAIIENPLFAVMNEPNSTLQRLRHKLTMLDAIDEQSASGKLDMIIQLPYTIKTDSKRLQAEQRRTDIETQLKGSKYGIAYADGTEKITQLNRPAENNLLKQVEYLTDMLYGQLGITAEIMNGTADEKAMLNYHNRTVEPILRAITEEFARKFLTKTARTRKHTVRGFKDPFKYVPIASIAEIADKFTRNEILTSNEIRQFIGIKPHADAKADELRNSNIAAPIVPVEDGAAAPLAPDAISEGDEDEDAVVTEAFDSLDSTIGELLSDPLFADLGVSDEDS